MPSGLVSDLISRVLRRMDEQDPLIPVHWSREEILVYVNNAIAEYQLIAMEMQTTVYVIVNTSDNVYPVPESILVPFAVSAPHSLRRCAISTLDKESCWESPRGSRLGIREWCPIGADMFLIYPRPKDIATVAVEGLALHEPLLDDGICRMPIRPEYEQCIEDWCVERAAFKEGGQLLSTYGGQYEQFLTMVQRIRGIEIIKMRPLIPKGVVDHVGLKERVEEIHE